jgi:sporulation protein YlmC with PRC-barrel domain
MTQYGKEPIMNDQKHRSEARNQSEKNRTPGPDMRKGPGPELMSTDTLSGNDVYNSDGEDLGEVKDFMLDMSDGTVGYAVLSFGAFLGMGEKLFAVPWNALKLDTENKRFILNVDTNRLKNAPGFDKGHWPDMADQSWAQEIHSYYGTKPHTDSHSLQ